LDRLKAAREKSITTKRAMGEATRLTQTAKKVEREKTVKEKTEKAKKILEEGAPVKPEKTLDTIEKADKWKEYYHTKYKQKKAALKADIPEPKKLSPPEYAREVAKEELKEYVTSEALVENGYEIDIYVKLSILFYFFFSMNV
jgi:hypothetical protein